MKTHYRIVKTASASWYHCTTLPALGWGPRNEFHCALMAETFGDAIRLLSKLATQPKTEEEQTN
jgi:hypothetical protein